MSTGMVFTSWSVRTSMTYALFARVPPVTTYRPSGDIITMCGLTLFPRKTFPTIILLLMSMNAMSFESRFTIMTTDVGSVILMAGFWAPTTAVASVLPSTATSAPMRRRPAALTMTCSLKRQLESRLETDTRKEISELALVARIVDDVLQRQRQPQPLGELEVVVPFHELLIVARGEVRLCIADAPGVPWVEREPGAEREPPAPVMVAIAGDLSCAVPSERHHMRCQLLVDADPDGPL